MRVLCRFVWFLLLPDIPKSLPGIHNHNGLEDVYWEQIRVLIGLLPLLLLLLLICKETCQKWREGTC